MDKERELFSTKVSAGKRTYFFDIRVASNGVKYLAITESKHIDGSYKRNRIFIFQEHIPLFIKGLKEALKFIKT